MKKLLSLLFVLTVTPWLCISVFAAAQPDAPDTIIIASPPQIDTKMPSVEFPHKKHEDDVKCATCHHMKKNKDAYVGCASQGCHDQFKDRSGKKTFYQAFHGRYDHSCLGCHRDRKDEDKEHGPTTCFECHSKNKK